MWGLFCLLIHTQLLFMVYAWGIVGTEGMNVVGSGEVRFSFWRSLALAFFLSLNKEVW